MLVEGNELHRTRLALRDVGCLLHKVEGGGGGGQRGRRVKWKEEVTGVMTRGRGKAEGKTSLKL